MRKRMMGVWNKVLLKWMKFLIRRYDEFEITELLLALMRRYGILHPDYELVCFTLPKNPEKRESESDDEIVDR